MVLCFSFLLSISLQAGVRASDVGARLSIVQLHSAGFGSSPSEKGCCYFTVFFVGGEDLCWYVLSVSLYWVV